MAEPAPLAMRWGHAARQRNIMPLRLSLTNPSQTSVGSSGQSLPPPVPAFATMMSSRP